MNVQNLRKKIKGILQGSLIQFIKIYDAKKSRFDEINKHYIHYFNFYKYLTLRCKM